MLRVEGSDASIHFTSVNEATTQRKEKKGRTCHHDFAKVKRPVFPHIFPDKNSLIFEYCNAANGAAAWVFLKLFGPNIQASSVPCNGQRGGGSVGGGEGKGYLSNAWSKYGRRGRKNLMCLRHREDEVSMDLSLGWRDWCSWRITRQEFGRST